MFLSGDGYPHHCPNNTGHHLLSTSFTLHMLLVCMLFLIPPESLQSMWYDPCFADGNKLSSRVTQLVCIAARISGLVWIVPKSSSSACHAVSCGTAFACCNLWHSSFCSIIVCGDGYVSQLIFAIFLFLKLPDL